MIDVETPDGKTFAIDDPALIERLRADVDQTHALKLLHSDKAMTDCRPLSIFAIQTAKKLGEETSETIIAAKNEDRDALIRESCDLIYHLLVLFTEREVSLAEVRDELSRRRSGAP